VYDSGHYILMFSQVLWKGPNFKSYCGTAFCSRAARAAAAPAAVTGDTWLQLLLLVRASKHF
jgi:hypothetical protein